MRDDQVAHCLICDRFFEAKLKVSTEEYICICPDCAKPKVKSLNNLEVGDEVENDSCLLKIIAIGEDVEWGKMYLVSWLFKSDQSRHITTCSAERLDSFKLVEKKDSSIIDEMLEFMEASKQLAETDQYMLDQPMYDNCDKFITFLKELKNGK